MSDENLNRAAAAAPEGLAGRRPGDPYEVGFARPPKATQFKKGRSGNPKGRPKASEVVDVRGAMQKVLERRVTITVAGVKRRVTIQQALILKLRELALAGEPAMQRRLLKVLAGLPQATIRPRVDLGRLHMKLSRLLGEWPPEDDGGRP